MEMEIKVVNQKIYLNDSDNNEWIIRWNWKQKEYVALKL